MKGLICPTYLVAFLAFEWFSYPLTERYYFLSTLNSAIIIAFILFGLLHLQDAAEWIERLFRGDISWNKKKNSP